MHCKLAGTCELKQEESGSGLELKSLFLPLPLKESELRSRSPDGDVSGYGDPEQLNHWEGF